MTMMTSTAEAGGKTTEQNDAKDLGHFCLGYIRKTQKLGPLQFSAHFPSFEQLWNCIPPAYLHDLKKQSY